MLKKILGIVIVAMTSCSWVSSVSAQDRNELIQIEVEREIDSIFHYSSLAYLQPDAFRLTELDIKRFAARLDLDPAAVMAVIEIESGKSHKGFYEPQHPIINFDIRQFRKRLQKSGADISKLQREYPELFSRPDKHKYGSLQRVHQERFDIARGIDDVAAVESTFWGMFQIGGFNWEKCGVSSVDEFVNLMSRSERDQLDLFGKFLDNTGMLDYVRNKQWNVFARAYNGPGYRARSYDKRLAAAYARYKALLEKE